VNFYLGGIGKMCTVAIVLYVVLQVTLQIYIRQTDFAITWEFFKLL